MPISVHGQNLSGTVAAVASKSVAHRLLICASLSQTPSTIDCPEVSDDIEATVNCLRALGARIERLGQSYEVTPISMAALSGTFDPTGAITASLGYGPLLPACESGSTLRFLLPVVAALGRLATFTLAGRLPQRPLSPLYEELVEHGAELSPAGRPVLAIAGPLRPGVFTLPGDISSQYISGLLFALPLLAGPSEIHLEGPLESVQYVEMTLAALSQYGISIEKCGSNFIVLAPQKYEAPAQVAVEGDWSGAAFWLCAGTLSTKGVEITNLNLDSLQGDKAILELLKGFGAQVERRGDNILVRREKALVAIEIDAQHIPDLVPILAVVASVARGVTKIYNAKRLRLKESDRLTATKNTLAALGAKIETTDDGLIIEGVEELKGGHVTAHGDHRMAMMAAIASTVSQSPVVIDTPEVVAKSYPAFFADFQSLGGKCFG